MPKKGTDEGTCTCYVSPHSSPNLSGAIYSCYVSPYLSPVLQNSTYGSPSTSSTPFSSTSLAGSLPV